MRLDRVKLRGIGPFRDEVRLDLDDLGDATIVAVCGNNGDGKSSLLELALPGAFYRHMPTQGTLRDRATARDALLEVTVTGAARYTIRHLIDGVSGKGETVVLDGRGQPVMGSTKVSDFDAWAARTLPAEEVLLASIFGAQQDRGFLGASPSDRKAILLRTLGIERYEAWATAAGERARASKQALEVARARLDEARRAGGNPLELSAALALAEAEAERADAELAQARAALSELEERARAAAAALAAHAAHAARHAELSARVRTLEGKRQDLDARIAACTRTLSQEGAIRQAAAKLETAQAELAELERERLALIARDEAAQERRNSVRARAEEARRHAARVSSRIADLERVLAQGATIARAETEIVEVDRQLGALRQALSDAQAARDAISAEAVAGAEERVQALRSGLVGVGDARTLEAAHKAAEASLTADDGALLAASERPARLLAARRAVDDAVERLAQAETRQRQLSALARRAGEVTAARDQLAELRTELEQHTEAVRTHEATARPSPAELVAAVTEGESLRERRQTLVTQAEALRPLAEQLPHIALAASKLEERRAQKLEVTAELDTATQALAALGPAPELVAAVDVAPERARAEALERAARAAHQAVAVAASTLERARAAEAQIRDLEARQRAEETELADWTRLSEDLGRKGLQAAEIDGCGPELTALVNDLLHEAHGPRWSVRIDTQKLSADGKRTLEGCQVTVLDTVRGREDEGQHFSGGERVILGEALALGLSMLACQRSGLRGITLVRDETGAALDPGNAEVYVRMLRRAAEQIGADRVLFVSHNPEAAELADARITVRGGQLVVDAQGRRVAA
jgi:DNA repair exonuclease SbcCD ATPase subunit